MKNRLLTKPSQVIGWLERQKESVIMFKLSFTRVGRMPGSGDLTSIERARASFCSRTGPLKVLNAEERGAASTESVNISHRTEVRSDGGVRRGGYRPPHVGLLPTR
jgi:hypothetical protein